MMKVRRRLVIIGVLFFILNMVVATQYAVTKVGYQYTIVHPCDASIRFIGSDNSTDATRVLRVSGSNTSSIALTLSLGNVYSTNMIRTFSAAFGIVNEENFALNITHINVSSANYTYMKIFLHGNRTADASNITMDPSRVLMWNNNTMVNTTNTTAWILASGNNVSSDMCYNVSDRTNCSINTTWDEKAHVRYSLNNSIAVSNQSDYVWVQITLDIPEVVNSLGQHVGTIWIHYESETT